MNEMKWSLVLISYIGLFWLGFVETIRGPLYPDILKEWSLSTERGALFFALASFAGLIVNLLGRWWLPFLGGWRSLQIFSLFLAISCFGMGWGARYGFFGVLLFSIAFGVSLGGLGIAVNLLAVQGSSLLKRRQVLSGLHSCYGLASLIAPQALIGLGSVGLGWKLSMQWVALGPLFLFLLTFFRSPAKASIPPTKKFTAPKRVRWLLSFMLAFYVGAEMILSSRMALLLRSEFSFSTKEASTYITVFFAGLMLGRLVIALRRFQWSNQRFAKLSLLLSLTCYLLGLYVHPFFLATVGFTMSVFFPCLISLFSECYPKWSDEIIATVMAAMGLVLVVVHWSVGRVAAMSSVKEAMMIGPLLLIISFGMLALWKWPEEAVSGE